MSSPGSEEEETEEPREETEEERREAVEDWERPKPLWELELEVGFRERRYSTVE